MLCILFLNSLSAQKVKLKAGLIFVPQAEFKLTREFTNGGYPIAGSREIQSGTFEPALHSCFSIEYKNWGVIPFYTLNSNSIGLSPSVSFFDGKLGFYGVASKSLSDSYSGYLGGGISTPVGGTATNPLGFAFVEYGKVFTPGGEPNYKAFYVGAFVPLLADVKKLKIIF